MERNILQEKNVLFKIQQTLSIMVMLQCGPKAAQWLKYPDDAVWDRISSASLFSHK